MDQGRKGAGRYDGGEGGQWKESRALQPGCVVQSNLLRWRAGPKRRRKTRSLRASWLKRRWLRKKQTKRLTRRAAERDETRWGESRFCRIWKCWGMRDRWRAGSRKEVGMWKLRGKEGRGTEKQTCCLDPKWCSTAHNFRPRWRMPTVRHEMTYWKGPKVCLTTQFCRHLSTLLDMKSPLSSYLVCFSLLWQPPVNKVSKKGCC